MELIDLIIDRKWTEVLVAVKKDRNIVRKWIVEKNYDGNEIWKSLPIHLVCEKNPPSKVLKELYEVYPESVEIRNSGDDLPLHVLCRSSPSQKEEIRFLANCFPKAMEMKGGEGCLPLHLLCQKDADCKLVEEIYVNYPTVSRSRDEFDLLPLHWACLKDAPFDVMDLIIRTCPAALEWKDKWERTPRDIYEQTYRQSLQPGRNEQEIERKLSILKMCGQNTPESFWVLDPLHQIAELKEELVTTRDKLLQCRTERDELMEENVRLDERIETLKQQESKHEKLWKQEFDSLEASNVAKDKIIADMEEQNLKLQKHLRIMKQFLETTLADNIQTANSILNTPVHRELTKERSLVCYVPNSTFDTSIEEESKNECSQQMECYHSH